MQEVAMEREKKCKKTHHYKSYVPWLISQAIFHYELAQKKHLSFVCVFTAVMLQIRQKKYIPDSTHLFHEWQQYFVISF